MRLHTVVSTLVMVLVQVPHPAAAQDVSILIDFGSSGFPTNGTVGDTWNEVDETSLNSTFDLVDTTGQPTGITWKLSGSGFQGVNSAGTSTPEPDSPLGQFPVSATRDVAYGSGNTVVVEVTGLAPNTLVDFTFGASRTNVTDMRTTDYVVQGFNSGVGTLDPSNNVSDIAQVDGILVDSTGTITLSMRAALENTNARTHYYYVGALRADLTLSPGPPAVLAFGSAQIPLTIIGGTGVYAVEVELLESLGATQAVTLSAKDDATGLPPTWLSLPAAGATGSSATLTFDDTGLALGDYSATVTATAAGYADASLDVTLQVEPAGGLNLLFYGNSYSQGNGTMPDLVEFIAEDSGQQSPDVYKQLVGGQDLFFHLTDPNQAEAITSSLPLGQSWDFVIMQGHSQEATHVGDPAAFRANALAILTNVKAHSPDAKAVMFQTWARGPEYSGYPGTWSGPLEMHDEIRTNYRLAVADMNVAFGQGSAYLAAAGDAVALLAFDSDLYTSDWSHPEPPTTLLTAMAVYQAIWRKRISDVDPDFGASTNLVTRLNNLGLSEADWIAKSGIAERIADANVRRHPGSSEDLLLETGVNAEEPNARPLNFASTGDTLAVRLTSPNGLYAEKLSHVVFDVFSTGFPPPANPFFPEVHIKPSYFIVATTAPLGPGIAVGIVVPPAVLGLSILVQGVANAPSVETGNTDFTTTDGHEVEFQ
jgi:hypothetical protein